MVDAFDQADPAALAALYAADAVNHQVAEGLIRFQRGFWDKLAFLRLHGLPLPTR